MDQGHIQKPGRDIQLWFGRSQGGKSQNHDFRNQNEEGGLIMPNYALETARSGEP
jgi:hypothetical protein